MRKVFAQKPAVPGSQDGPHGQLVERYAARLVGDGLVRHGTWRCCNVVGGLLSWIASRGCALADLVLGISIPASILLRCRRYCSTLRSSSWRGVRARVFCARRSPAGQTPTRISPGGGIQSPLPLSLSVAKRAGLGSAEGDFVRRHRLHQRAPPGHKLGGRGARRLPSHRGRGGGRCWSLPQHRRTAMPTPLKAIRLQCRAGADRLERSQQRE